MGIPTFFILVLFLKFFQFFSFLSLFFPYFLTKSPQAFELYSRAYVFVGSPHTITSGLLNRDGSNLIKIASEISENGGDL